MFAYAKAIAAFITSGLMAILIPLGINGDTTLGNAIEILVLAALTAASVYFVPNQK
jgi:hypothetical protein